jgi:DNA-binding CsgD family transcriptional regulator
MNATSHPRPVPVPATSATAGNDRQQLSDLISLVYDAAIDQSLWENAIEKVAYFVGGVGAGLFWKDVDAQHVSASHRYGIVWPLPVALFRQIYPAAVGHFLAEIEQPVATADLMPYHEIVETGFHREWAQPQGIVDFVSAVLDKSVTTVAMFGVFRHERNGFVDDEARHRMRLIVPHIRRAVMIASLFLVDPIGRIVHANAAGHALLHTGDILHDAGGRLAGGDPQVNQTLREIFAAAGQGDAALGTKGIALPLIGQDGERYIAHALPLTSGARRRAGIIFTAVAALFVRKAALAMSSRSEVIGKMFKLTPTELRVLLAIAEIGGVPEVAAALGVADTTVRTHVGNLFEKTGAKRQADLVRLVAGYATPMGA